MSNVPTSYLVPGHFITTDNSAANTLLSGAFETVVFGQKTSAGTATANEITQVYSAANAAEQFGVGSVLHEMFKTWFAKNPIGLVSAIPLDDEDASTAAAFESTITGTATAAGTLFCYINGFLIRAGIANGDTASVAGDSLANAINANPDLPVTAANVAGVVTLTANNKGTLGNQVDVRFNYETNDSFPEGLSVAVASSVTGATDPDLTDAIAGLPDEVYKMFVTPYTDSANLGILDTELERRWGATVKLYGEAVTAYSGTTSEMVTFGDTLNSQFICVVDNGKATMMPAYLRAATVGSVASLSASADPSLKFENLEIEGDGDARSDRRNDNERNTLLNAGISTLKIGNDGTVYIERLVTTYKENASGSPDNSYRNLNTPLNLQDFNLGWETRANSIYARSKLADDGTVFGGGQRVATPSSIKADLIAYYEELVLLGRYEDVDSFSESIIVERDAVNRSRANITCSPILVGQFYQTDLTNLFLI